MTSSVFAVTRSFSRNLQYIDKSILDDICQTPNDWLKKAVYVNDGCRAIFIDDTNVLVLQESHGYLIIVDICEYEKCISFPNSWRFSNDTADFLMLSEFLGYDLFWHYTDEQLYRIGVPCEKALLRAIRKIHTLADLNNLIDNEMLDDDTAEILIQLCYSGYKTAGLCHSEMLEEMPLERWRSFLHPIQVKYATSTFDGPFLLTGGAGTGKTLVAIHRAIALASRLSGSQKLLFTTFGKTLTSELEYIFSELCKTQHCEQALDHIKIIAIDDWTIDYLKKNIDPQIQVQFKAEDLKKTWRQCLSEFPEIAQKYSCDFFVHDWQRVVIAENCKTAEDYMNAKQLESCRPLTANERKTVWPTFEKYMQYMKEHHVYDIHFAQRVCETILSGQNTPLYNHIIADECQDLSVSALRLLRAIAGPQHVNDIFLCGDTSQRIFATRGQLLECGIDTTNRTENLYLNYRTPHANHQYALRFLQKQAEETEESPETYCVPRGTEPERKAFNNIDEESEYVCQKIIELTQSKRKTALENICLVHRKNAPLEIYCDKLKKHNILYYRIDNSNPFNDPKVPGVRVTTMHRVKGLEFDDIFILGTTEENISCAMPYFIFEDERRESENIEKCVLYVAVTRARHKAWITANEPHFSHLIP